MVIDRTATGRPLGSMETALTLLDQHWAMNLVAVLRLAPAPDAVQLAAALAHVQRRHPALRARIAPDRRSFRFVYGDVPAIPLDVLERPDDDHWMEVAAEGLNEHLPAEQGPLARAVLLRGAHAGELVMAFHHAAVDGASVASLLGELLGSYGGAADGPPLIVPPAAEELRPTPRPHIARHLLREMAAEPRYRLAMRRAGATRVQAAARSQVLNATLDAGATAAISREARRRRLTVPSVIQAALLIAIHRRRYGGAELPLRTFSLADLRPHFEPPVGPEPLACYVALTSQDVPMRPGRDLWELAADVQGRVERSVRGDAKFTAAAAAQPLMRMALATKRLRMGNVALSYTGNLAPQALPGPLVVRGVHAFVSNLPIGPELSLRAGMLDGGLSFDAMANDADMDRTEMQALLDDLAAALSAAASPAEE